jgi:signal transduction histidine kinase
VSVAEPEKEFVIAPAFLSVMAHELSQPLTAALGWAHAIKNHASAGKLDDATVEHLSEIALRNLEQLQALLDSLRVFSETEDGKLKVAPRNVSVHELLRDAQEDFGTPSSRTRMTIECEPDLQVEVDLMLFRQVLSNLISNALKFSPRDSLIAVEAHSDNGDVVVSVSDRGGGFPVAEAERIFEKSVRLRPENKGLGVGLFVAKAIVEAHGGQIRADNIEGGARFSVAIPAA